MLRKTALSSVSATMLACAIQMSASAPAMAQVAATANGDDTTLTDIIVTAQKREENLQRAALAVSAISADDLQRAAVTNATQLTDLTPALQINTTFGPTANFFLRGVGNFVTNVASDPAVIVNLDGVPIGRPTGVQGLFYDLQRVEVLKGPQGTLYGRNATGGAINVISAQPIAGETLGYINASYGNYNAFALDAALNVPLGDNGAFRVAAMQSKRDGTYSDGSGDEDIRAVRATMAGQVTPDLKLTASFDYAKMGGKGPGSTVSGLNHDQRIGLNDPRAGALYAAAFSFLPGTNLLPLNTPIFQDNNFYGARLQADLATGVGTISLIPAYRRSEINMLSQAAGQEVRTIETAEQTSIELRLVSDAGHPLQYVFGAIYFNETDASLNDYNYEYASFLDDIHPRTNSYAAYGRLTYSVTPSFRISAGLRYTIDKRAFDDSQVAQLVICPGALENPPFSGGGLPFTTHFCFGAPRLPVQVTPVTYRAATPGGAFLSASPLTSSRARTYRKATWRVGAEYDLWPQSLLYASVETGYKSGGFFATPDPVHNFYQPETITAYTIGSKNRFFGNRLQLNVEAFWWQYKDQQVSHFINFGPIPVFATENIGNSRLRGFEIEARAKVTHHTEIEGSIQYLDARNTSFSYLSSAAGGPPITGCAVTALPGAYNINCSGTRPQNAPRWTASLGIQQKIPLGNAGDLNLFATTRYQSSIVTGSELLPSQVQKGYFMSDAQVEYKTASGKLSIAAFVKNIENENVVGYSQAHPRVGASLLIENLRLPRTYGIRAGVKF